MAAKKKGKKKRISKRAFCGCGPKRKKGKRKKGKKSKR